MSSAFSRIEASKSAAKVRVADAFKNEAGAFDLPSILVGVVVVGVLTAGVLASIFGIIPFAQDKGAQQDLGAITTAQGVYKAQTSNGANYGANLAALQAPGVDLVGDGITNVVSAGDTDEWAAVSKSASGKFYAVTSQNTTPVDVTAAAVGADDSSKLNAALASKWDSAAVAPAAALK